MDFHTDFKKNLLDTDRIDEVEFEEYKNYDNNDDNNVDTDYAKQFGGKNDNLNYLDDYTSAQYNSKRLDSYEKEFFGLYDKALEFRKRIIEMENKQKNINKNQYGGQDEPGEKKKRPLPPAIKLMQELTKIMKDTGKYPEIKQVQFIKISKMIVDDAKEQTGMKDVNETVRQAALKIVKNPDEYIKRFKNEQSSTGKSDAKSVSNSRNSSSKSKNFRNDRNQSETNRSESKNSNATWKGSDSNYRNYAQADLWNDKNESDKKSSNDRDINRYGTASFKADLRNDNEYQPELNEPDYDVLDRVQKNKKKTTNKPKSRKRSNLMY